MNIRLPFFLAALVLAASAIAIDPIEFENPAEEARFQALAKELRCLVCQNESLADSTAGLAQDLRADVIAQMREGRSDTEIKNYMTDRYGDFILYSPPVKPRTWLLWFGPLLMLLFGAGVLALIIRRGSAPKKVSEPNDPIKGDWQ
jgi:cytochrome c-type biogenesis protein CcmH